MSDLKDLKVDAKGFSILYVEDNKALRENASKLLVKFFDTVYSAMDGEKGLEVFKKELPDIVITDIKMPHMDGMQLTKQIKDIEPKTKVLVMSAFDDSEYLYSAIEYGVFRFLKKPVNINELAAVLYACVKEIKKEQTSQLFNTHLQSVFNYQSSIVIMMQDSKPTFANQMFMRYFDVKSVEEFVQKYKDLGTLFLKHDTFLFNDSKKRWFDEVSENQQKLYNIKLKDKDNNLRHFILKYQTIPDKQSYGILSFDDVTELNLLKLYDSSQSKSDDNIKNAEALYNLLKVIQRNHAKVELHNFYKGISITHDALIVDIKKDTIILKTDYMQERAIQFDKRSFITSDALPNVVACDNVAKISFKHQSVEFTNIHFTLSSPVSRKALRVVPKDKHTVSLFLGENRYHGDISVEDISLEAVRLNLESMPAALEVGDEVMINIVLAIDSKPTIINTKAKMYKKQENKRSFTLVFMFEFRIGEKHNLVEYMTSRQMEIIREFKGLQNG